MTGVNDGWQLVVYVEDVNKATHFIHLADLSFVYLACLQNLHFRPFIIFFLPFSVISLFLFIFNPFPRIGLVLILFPLMSVTRS